jgi:hypothetical protein
MPTPTATPNVAPGEVPVRVAGLGEAGWAAVVVGVAVLAHAGGLGNGFTWDDHTYVVANPLVTGEQPGWGAFLRPYQPGESPDLLYRPVTTLSFAVQWALLGPGPGSFHAVNVLLHALVALLLGAWARRLVPGRPRVAVLAALVFAVHAVHTDAVSSVVGRADVLAALFTLAAWLAWLRFRDGDGLVWGVGAAMALGLGALSKETALVLPLVAVAWAWADGRTWRSVAWLGLPAVGCLVVRGEVLGGFWSSSARYFSDATPWTAAWTMVGVAGRYAALLVVPHPLSPDYSYDSVPLSQTPFEAWPLVGLLGLGGAAWVVARAGRGGDPAVGWGVAWLLIFLLPASNLVPLMVPMAERFLYLPSAGFCVVVAALLDRGWVRAPRLAGALAVVWLLGLLVLTVERERAWRDDESLWTATLRVFPRNALALANLAAVRYGQDRVPEGHALLRRALEVDGRAWAYRAELADRLHVEGRHDEEARVLWDGLRWRGRAPVDVERTCRAVEEALGMGREECVRRAGGP